MVSKIFLDANILLDLTLERDSHARSRILFQSILDEKLDAFVSPSIVHIVAHWLTKSRGPLHTRKILLTLLTDVHVLEMSHEIVLLALASSGKDIEVALQYHTALHHKMDVFISNDKELKQSSLPSLPVMTVEEFLRTL